MIEYNEKKQFNVLSIDNLKEILENYEFDEQFLSCLAVSSLDNYLILSNEIQVFIINIKTKQLLCVSNVITPKSLEDFKLNKIYPIENTNDYIGLSNSFQVFYIEHNQPGNTINVFAKNDLSKGFKIEIMKNLIVVLESDKLSVYNLNDIKINKSLLAQFEIRVGNVEHFSLSDDCNYLAIFEMPKSLSLYRLKDYCKCAQVALYCGINSMIINDKFVSLAMKDRRIISFLIVDPLEIDHINRIKELPSRYGSFLLCY